MAYKTGNSNADTAASTLVTGGELPDIGAAIDMQATDKGLLIPRMTTLQRDILMPPAAGPIYSEKVISDSPISYWRYGEASGTVAVDEMGLDNQTYTNNPTLGVPGLMVNGSDTAVLFNDTGGLQYTEAVGSPLEYSFIGTAFSLETWFVVNSLVTSNPMITKLGTGATPNNEYWWEVDTTGSVNLILHANISTANNHQAFTAPGVISTGVLYHAVSTYSGAINSGKTYINGVLVPVNYVLNGTFTAMSSTIEKLKLGARFVGGGAQAFFDGTLDEPAIYNYELSAAQILEHYNIGITP